MTTTVLGVSDSGYLESDGATFAIAHDGLGTLTPVNLPVDANIYAYSVSAGGIAASESFFEFDLSTISDYVETVLLRLYFDGGFVEDSPATVEVYAFDWGGTVTGADWRDKAWLAAATLLGSYQFAVGAPSTPDELLVTLTLEGVVLRDLVEASRPGTLRLMLALDRVRLGSSSPAQLTFSTDSGGPALLTVIHGPTGEDDGAEGVGLALRSQRRRAVKSWPSAQQAGEMRGVTTKELAMPVASVRITSVRPATGSIRTKRDGTL